jgi:predicted Zn finger-like uncharacterized protein
MVRLRRLQADYERVTALATHHPRLQLLRADGTPPERYQLEYRVKSLRQKDGQLQEVSSHVVELFLPRDYPRTPPLCRMLTPVFHPNIAPHAICIGDHWSAGESLSSLVTRIGEMLAYQSYNTKSPLNGEAAKWTDQNLERLPLDAVNMHIEETCAAPTSAPAAATRLAGVTAPPIAPPPIQRPHITPPPLPATVPTDNNEPFIVACPGCSAKIRVKQAIGQEVRCPRCKTVFPVMA